MPLTRKVLAATSAATLLLYLVPFGAYAIYPLLLLATVVHELGHAVAVLLCGGELLSVHLATDGSGVTYHAGPGGTAAGLVAAGGLCGPTVAGAILLVIAARPGAARATLAGFGVVLGAMAALYVRGRFGVAFTASAAAVAIAIAAFTRPRTAQLALIVVAVQLALSIAAHRGYLASAAEPSDTQAMAHALGGTPQAWGLACAAFALLGFLGAAAIFWRATRRDAISPTFEVSADARARLSSE